MESFEIPDAGGFDFDFDLSGFDVGFEVESAIENQRYQKPVMQKTKIATYENAVQLAEEVDLHEGFRAFCLLSGNFIFGDFIEAMTELDKWRIDKITIHTLTMSQDSIDSLSNVIDMDQPSSLHIIMSDYWYAHEQGKANGLLWELYEKCDIGDGFRLAFCRTHAKVCTIQTKSGHKIVLHGSANLRSHGVIEQMTIENDPNLYDFIEAFNDGILNEYDIINHKAKRMRPVGTKRLGEIARRHIIK